MEKAKCFLSVLETKEKLLKLMENHGEMAFTVRIGPETGIPELEDCSLVTATYRLSDNTMAPLASSAPRACSTDGYSACSAPWASSSPTCLVRTRSKQYGKEKRKQRGDTMQDVTQKPLTNEAQEAVETMEAAVETAMDADEAHEQAREEMAQDTAAAEAAEALAAAIAKQEEYLTMAQRVQADFENSSAAATRTSARRPLTTGRRAFATTLLPVIDNLERAIAAAGESAGEEIP